MNLQVPEQQKPQTMVYRGHPLAQSLPISRRSQEKDRSLVWRHPSEEPLRELAADGELEIGGFEAGVCRTKASVFLEGVGVEENRPGSGPIGKVGILLVLSGHFM